MNRITCLGILVADLIAKPVKKMPQRGKLELTDKVFLYTGGCATNTSMALAKLGFNTAVIGKVGNDIFGDFIINKMNEAGVNTQQILRSNSTNTSTTLVFVDETGERSFVHSEGANGEIKLEDIDWDFLKESKIVHIAGSFLMPGFDGGKTAAFLKKAQSLGITTSLDTAWDARGLWMDLLEESLPYLDYFLPSYEEAVQLSGYEEPEKIAVYFLNKGVKNVGIKMGGKGSYAANKEKSVFKEVFDVEVKDTTGAGDAWAAGFLVGVSKGWELEKTCLFANAVGASAVQKIGASTGIKTMNETLKMIK